MWSLYVPRTVVQAERVTLDLQAEPGVQLQVAQSEAMDRRNELVREDPRAHGMLSKQQGRIQEIRADVDEDERSFISIR